MSHPPRHRKMAATHAESGLARLLPSQGTIRRAMLSEVAQFGQRSRPFRNVPQPANPTRNRRAEQTERGWAERGASLALMRLTVGAEPCRVKDGFRGAWPGRSPSPCGCGTPSPSTQPAKAHGAHERPRRGAEAGSGW